MQYSGEIRGRTRGRDAKILLEESNYINYREYDRKTRENSSDEKKVDFNEDTFDILREERDRKKEKKRKKIRRIPRKYT